MTLSARVSALGDKVTDADRRILDVLLSHPTEASFLPASEVTDRAGVHVATATKLAQKLGYTGYPALRRSMQSELLSGASPADRVRRRVEQAGDGDLLDSLVADEVAALRDLGRQVPPDQVERAASVLREARHRYIFGRGNASVLAELVGRRLRRFGLPTTVLPADGRGLAEHIVGLRPDDALLAFGLRRMPRHLISLLEHCGALGTPVVAVSDTLGAELGGYAEVLLSGARGSGRDFQSLTVPMAITNAVVLALARQAPGSSEEALARLEKLLGDFED